MRKRVKKGSEYLKMSNKQLNKLPAFDDNGDIIFYRAGRLLFSKESLIRWVQEEKALQFCKKFPNP